MTKYYNVYNNNNKLLIHSDKFYRYLVGLTDGDGTFNIYTSIINNKINFTFKISLSKVNIKLLYYLKKELGVGQVILHNINKKDGNQATYRIRNKKDIINIILPIFDKYPLLTSKYYNYKKFKESIIISNNNDLTQIEKINNINNIKNIEIFNDYKSPI